MMHIGIDRIYLDALWQLICELYRYRYAKFESSFSTNEKKLLKYLIEKQIVLPAKNYNESIMCPDCAAGWAEIFTRGKNNEGLSCFCEECGVVTTLTEAMLRAWVLKPDWFEKMICGAFSFSFKNRIILSEQVQLLGTYNGHPVVLAHVTTEMLTSGDMIRRVRKNGNKKPYLLCLNRYDKNFNPPDLEVIILQLCFSFKGNRLKFIAPIEESARDGYQPTAVHGPFSEDFRTVFIGGDVIALTPSQAKIFKVLWNASGIPMRGEEVMYKAGLNSLKPSEAFRFRIANQPTPMEILRKKAYHVLIQKSDAHDATYRLATCEHE